MQPLWKTVWQFLKKLNIKLPYDLAILSLRVYPRELKIFIHTKICTQMFIVVLFIIAQTTNAGVDVEKREPSCTVGGNVN